MSGRPQRVCKCVTTQHFPYAGLPLARGASHPFWCDTTRSCWAPGVLVLLSASGCEAFPGVWSKEHLVPLVQGGGSASGTEGALVNASLEGSPGKLWAPKQNYMPYTAGAKKGPCYGAAETAGCSGTFERPTTAKRRPS